MVNVLTSNCPGAGRKVGIAVARFNEIVTERMLEGALATVREQGVPDDRVTVLWVPGAFELPTACRWLIDRGCDAVVMLGAVIKGGTDHYEYVCAGVTEGTMKVQLETGVSIGFGVLTCAEMSQALARAGGEHGNKGSDAAMAALAMADLKTQLALA
ncbi:MAG: 6,7-dimethyl-8-ribityllumazine synthase [Planctomycetes bacterium]|nr:6,7-dimethyl-8-ribityllumazine synthase [Planctomycetota bacterium]